MAKKKKFKVNKNTFLGTAAIIVIAAAIALIVIFYPAGTDLSIAATVNGKAITMGELDSQYDLVPQAYRSFITKYSILEGIINEELVLQEAEKMGLSATDEEVDNFIKMSLELYGMTDDDFVELVESQGMTVAEVKDSYKKKLAVSKVLNATVLSEIKVPVEDAKGYYEQNIELFAAADGYIAFEDVEEQIIRTLATERQNSEIEAYIEILRQDAEIEIFIEQEDPEMNFEIGPAEPGQESAVEEGLEEDAQEAPESSGSLGKCLASGGAKLYGAGWSSNTQSQIGVLGGTFDAVDYVNCEEVKCKDLGITQYPTWVIHGQKYPGEKSIEELSALAGC